MLQLPQKFMIVSRHTSSSWFLSKTKLKNECHEYDTCSLIKCFTHLKKNVITLHNIFPLTVTHDMSFNMHPNKMVQFCFLDYTYNAFFIILKLRYLAHIINCMTYIYTAC